MVQVSGVGMTAPRRSRHTRDPNVLLNHGHVTRGVRFSVRCWGFGLDLHHEVDHGHELLQL